jgi:bacillithiol system protein YtxJ
MARYFSLHSPSDLAEALEASHQEPVLLYKHSSTCPISARAQSQVQQLDDDDPPVYQVTVQTDRPLSQQIAQDFGIRHESPQAILVYRGSAVWDASHGEIRESAVREAAREAIGHYDEDADA